MVVPVLGLIAEAASLADIAKKWLRDGITYDQQRDFARTELGDVLWYLANVASRFNLSLEDVASFNLERTRNRYGFGPDRWQDPGVTADFEDGLPVEERFPRKLLFHLEETADPDGQPRSHMRVLEAYPNPFSSGRTFDVDPKGRGFTLGDPLRNNSLTDDSYRYHDALHIAHMAVLGWSPVLRSLLRLKRKSRPDIDDTQDSARGVDVEEGLTTHMASRAANYNSFTHERYIDNETLDYVLEHVRGLEVDQRPGWLWRSTIQQGFACMLSLGQHRGGYLLADLDEHRVTYTALRPRTLNQ